MLDAFAPGEHLGADEVFRRVSRSLPTTSPQAVYGVLDALSGAGLLRRIEPAGSPARYERRIGDNHHHLVCSSCGNGDRRRLRRRRGALPAPSTTNGFVVQTAEVTFWGLCPECQRARLTSVRRRQVG